MSIFQLGMNDVTEEMQAMKDKLSSKDAHVAAQTGQLMKKAAESEELKQALNEALHKLNNETSRVLQLESSLIKATSDLQNSNIASQNTSAALASTEEKLRLKDLEAKELENTLISLSHDSEGCHTRLGKIEQEKRILEARFKELEAASRASPVPPVTPRTPARTRSSSLSNVRISSLEKDLTELRAMFASRERELQITQAKLDIVQQDAIKANNEQMASETRLKSRIKELEELVEEKDEEQRYFKEQGGAGGLEREEALLKRIDEDDAKIEALERLIGDAHDLPTVKDKLRKCEEKLKSESSRIGELEVRHIALVKEKEKALDALGVAQRTLGELQGQLYLDVQSQSTIPSGPDEGTVANMQRLLNAVERLRGERDGLRRDMEFLDMESRFTIAALEAKVASLSTQPISFYPDNLPLITVTPSEEDPISRDIVLASTSEERWKEIHRLQRVVLGCGIVIGHLETGRLETEAKYNSTCSAYEEKLSSLGLTETRLHETDSRLATTIHLLEETTTQRNDAMSRLSALDVEWRTKLEDANAVQQESRSSADHLNAQFDDVSKALEAVASERDSLSLQVTNLNADLASARREVADAESRYTQLQFHQLSDMPSTQATKTLRSQIEELEARVMRRTEQIGIHQHDIKRLETNLKLQEERLAEMTTEMEMILAQKDAMVEDCADAREQRDEARTKVEKLEEEIERLEILLDDRGKEQETIIEVMFLNSARTKEKMGVDAGRFEEMRARVQSLLVERDTTLHNVHTLNESLEDAQQRLKCSEDNAQRLAESLASSQEELAKSVMSTQDLSHALSGKVRELEFQLESRTTEAAALASQLDTLQNESSAVMSQRAAAIADLESQLERTRSSLSSKETEYCLALEELQRQKDRLLANNDSEGELVQLKVKHVEELGQLQSQLVGATTALDELQARHESVQVEHKQSLADSAQRIAEVEQQLRDAIQELDHLKEAREKLETASRCHSEEIKQLEEQAAASNSQLSATREEKTEVESSLQHTVEELAKTRRQHEDRLTEAQDALAEVRTRLKDESNEMSRSREEVLALKKRLEEEEQRRAQDRVSFQQELQNAKGLHEQAELRANVLAQRVSALDTQIQNAESDIQALREDRRTAERDMTALEANIQRSLSMNRHLESQIHESEKTIANLRAELEQVQDQLAKVERACNTAEVNLSLQNAQHKREVSQLNRELETFKGRPNLERIVSELEERNNEMEELLRRKCEEIEDNDDVKLGLMKENKSLKTRVESLTRKVNNLQTKLAAAKASLPVTVSTEQQRISSSSSAVSSIPSASSSSSSSSPPTSVSTSASASRPRSNTMVGASGPFPHSSSISPPTVPERSNRVVSGPSALPRPKTPERRNVLGPVFRAMSPKKDKPKPEPSPVVQNKKRRAPDDFEGYEVPPQVFTAESLPGDGENVPDHSTPKVRRVLSSIQTGFTPMRHQNRPMIPLPSPKRANPVFMKSPATKSVPDFTNNAHSGALVPVDGKKRSWLGKIRGASATTQRDFPY